MKKNNKILTNIIYCCSALLVVGAVVGVVNVASNIDNPIIKNTESSENGSNVDEKKCNSFSYSEDAIILQFEDECETAFANSDIREGFNIAVENGHNPSEQDFIYADTHGMETQTFSVSFQNDSYLNITYNVSVVMTCEDYSYFSSRGIFRHCEFNDMTMENEVIKEINFSDLDYTYESHDCGFDEFCFHQINLGNIEITENLYYIVLEIVFSGSTGPDDECDPCPQSYFDCLILEPVINNTFSLSDTNNDEDSEEVTYVNGTTDDGLDWSQLS